MTDETANAIQNLTEALTEQNAIQRAQLQAMERNGDFLETLAKVVGGTPFGDAFPSEALDPADRADAMVEFQRKLMSGEVERSMSPSEYMTDGGGVDPRDLLTGYFSEFHDLMDSEFQKGQEKWGDGWMDADPAYLDRRVEDCFHQYRKAREAHRDERAALEAIASMANYPLMALALDVANNSDGAPTAMTDGGEPVTTEYGVLIEYDPPFHGFTKTRYWSPEPTSPEEAVQMAKEEHDHAEVLDSPEDVQTREVPAPDKWESDDPRIRTDGGTDVEQDPERLWNPDPPELPEPRLDGYRPGYTDFLLNPETINSDRDHWDHNYRSSGELGRVFLGVQFIGEDGFGDWFDYLNGPEREIIPGRYGGIYVAQDASTDYVAFSPACLKHSPEDVQDALAVARSPYVAAAALRAWYDRQFGVDGQMVRRNDLYKNQRRREEKDGWKSDGLTFEFTENETEDRYCERCTSHIPVGARVWTVTVPPGRTHEGRCTVCARGSAGAAESDGYNLNGPDPRKYPMDLEPAPGEDQLETDGGVAP